MRNGEIKAVDFVRRIREEHYRRLKGKAPEERRAFYRQQAEALHEKLGVERERKRTA